MNELHARILGVPCQSTVAANSSVRILPPVRIALNARYTCRGADEIGLLFGKVIEERLDIIAATSAGYRFWQSDPLSVDANYALGTCDALLQLDPTIQWVGLWAMRSDRQAPTLSDIEALHQHFQGQLLSEQQILLTAGWVDHALSFQATSWRDQLEFLDIRTPT